jgi:GNAT superfamily N-acetyltransferase
LNPQVDCGASLDPVVRHARAEDAEAIATLCEQLGYPTPPATIRERLADLAVHADHGVLVGECAGQVQGWLHISITRALEYGSCAEILGLVVDAQSRSSGVGKALVEEAERWVKARGVSELRVRSRDTRERAHRFYLREGFAFWKRQVVFRKAVDSGSE